MYHRANNKFQHELKVMNKDREKIEENFTSYYNPDPNPSSKIQEFIAEFQYVMLDPFMEFIPPNLSLTYKSGYLFHKK